MPFKESFNWGYFCILIFVSLLEPTQSFKFAENYRMEETYWNHLIVKLVLVSLFCWNFLKVWSNLPLQSLIVYLVGVISLFRDIWDIIELWLTLCKRYLYLCVYVNSYVWYLVFILDLIRVLDIYHVLLYHFRISFI